MTQLDTYDMYPFDIDRGDLQSCFVGRMNQLGFDGYGYFSEDDFKQTKLYKKNPKSLDILVKSEKKPSYTINGETDSTIEFHLVDDDGQVIFVIRPQYWGEINLIDDQPNFEYPKTHVYLEWYKYALRASRANQELTQKSINELFNEIESRILQLSE